MIQSINSTTNRVENQSTVHLELTNDISTPQEEQM
jgi:cell division protein FtsX